MPAAPSATSSGHGRRAQRHRHIERYFAIIAKGDEVLSWREMSARYAGRRIRLIEGSDHALSDFDSYLPEAMQFLGPDTSN